jgi:dUTP pyrophosphatase
LSGRGIFRNHHYHLQEEQMNIQLDSMAMMPERAHDRDAGLDLRSPVSVWIPACGSLAIDTGVHMEIPLGYAGLLCGRSGLNIRHGITCDGVIDSGYTGSIRVKLYNHEHEPYKVERGDKIGQVLIIPVVSHDLVVVDTLEDTERGDRGFGSTGR